MSGVFGGGKKAQAAAQAQAAQQAAEARKQTQTANEEAGRNQQQAERGTSGARYGRGSRALLTGNLSAASQLKQKMGA